FVLILAVAAVLNLAVFLLIDPIMYLLQVPEEIYAMMREYLRVIFWGILAAFLYNYFACLLRAVGNSVAPLIFLAVSSVMNIVLDLWFVLGFHWGVAGAAFATVLSQYVSGIGLAVYTYWKTPEFRIQPRYLKPKPAMLKEIGQFSFLTSVQQSVMNLGILMVQGLVNSFGTVIMAAFAAAVKIDSFAYMPAQEFGNAFSTFVAQNYGAGKSGRIREGIKKAVLMSVGFCLVISLLVFIFARPLMTIFVDPSETEILAAGVEYLRIEGAFYCGIGCLFLLYGLYRAIKRPGMSVVLTIFSLGTRVVLAYALSAIDFIGVTGIWWSVPIGWALADLVGFLYYKKNKKKLFN
ncbi:MAG TPA: MATE family efflux transporter, partial [Candidatus Blautia pullistercoris]|nr:MATE family efflux transporter [Candidatus Blautia pullistercoris]